MIVEELVKEVLQVLWRLRLDQREVLTEVVIDRLRGGVDVGALVEVNERLDDRRVLLQFGAVRPVDEHIGIALVEVETRDFERESAVGTLDGDVVAYPVSELSHGRRNEGPAVHVGQRSIRR